MYIHVQQIFEHKFQIGLNSVTQQNKRTMKDRIFTIVVTVEKLTWYIGEAIILYPLLVCKIKLNECTLLYSPADQVDIYTDFHIHHCTHQYTGLKYQSLLRDLLHCR